MGFKYSNADRFEEVKWQTVAMVNLTASNGPVSIEKMILNNNRPEFGEPGRVDISKLKRPTNNPTLPESFVGIEGK